METKTLMESQNLTYMQAYYFNNREKILADRKLQYLINKEIYNEKFLCACSGRFTWKNKTIHYQSQKHKDYVKRFYPFGIGEELIYLNTKNVKRPMKPIELDL